ncbi:MAG: hypothetical protein ABJ059_01295, partial [Hyphomicrobiales bacterium]
SVWAEGVGEPEVVQGRAEKYNDAIVITFKVCSRQCRSHAHSRFFIHGDRPGVTKGFALLT